MSQSADTVRQRGWYYGWGIVAVCILSQVAANGLTYNAYSLFLRDWSADLHAPISMLQLPIAGMALVAALLAPMIGVLADKYPARRKVLPFARMIGNESSCVATASLLLVESFGGFIIVGRGRIRG